MKTDQPIMKKRKLSPRFSIIISFLIVFTPLAWFFSQQFFPIEGFATETSQSFDYVPLPDEMIKGLLDQPNLAEDATTKDTAAILKTSLLTIKELNQSKTEEKALLATTPPVKEAELSPPEDFPTVSTKDWNLLLVGPDHKLTTEIDANQMTPIAPDELMDQRVAPVFEQLRGAAQEAGVELSVVSAYRSVADQTAVFDEKFQRMKAQGMTDEEAKKVTMTGMTEPGYSEHHTGLSVDVVDNAWLASGPDWTLSEDYGETVGGKWLQAHAAEFGFVIRYPKDKTEITKITYEPWHLRYVGVDVANYMNAHQLCLEEFIDEVEKWESYGS